MNWKETLKIKHLLDEEPADGLDYTEEQIRTVAGDIIEVLHTARYARGTLGPVYAALRSAKTQNGLNAAVATLFDWADDAGVWIA